MGSVCKSWREIVVHGGVDIAGGKLLLEKKRRVPELECILQLDSAANHHSHIPLLMTLNHRDGWCCFSHPFHSFTFWEYCPDLANATIRYAYHGWLLLTRRFVDAETKLLDCTNFFFNPITKESIELPQGIISPNGQHDPPRQYVDWTASMCFTSPPTCADCCVIAAGQFPDFAIFIWRHGLDHWEVYRHLGMTGDRNAFHIAGSTNPVMVGQRYCCCLAIDGRVGIFDLEHKSFSLHESPFPKPQFDGLKRSFLLEDKGELLAVFDPNPNHGELGDQLGRDIYAMTMKIDSGGGGGDGLLSLEWEPVVDFGKRLGDRMVFVSNCTGSFTKPAKVRSAGNKIYFPTSRNIYYSLATKKYHAFHSFLGPQFSTSCLLGLKEYPINACWIDSMGVVSVSDELEGKLISLV